MKKITFLTICILMVTNLFATDYYVKAGGSPTADGLSEATAFNTVNVAVSNAAVVDGDRIFIVGAITQTGGVTITKSLAFEGMNNAVITGGTVRMYNLSTASKTISFSGITFQNAAVTTVTTNGAVALLSVASTLSFNNCVFLNNNTTTGAGGALAVSAGDLTITNCTFSGNSTTAGNGGAIFADGAGVLSVTTSTFLGNSSSSSGGITANGGAISVGPNASRQSLISYSTFYNNTTDLQGGALAFFGTNATSELKNITCFENKIRNTGSNPDRGAGIRIEGARAFAIINTLVYGNTSKTSGTAIPSGIGAVGPVVLTLTNSLSNSTVPTPDAALDFVTGSNIAAVLTKSNIDWDNTLNKVTFTGPDALADPTPIDFGNDLSDIGAWDSKINIFKATTNNVWDVETNWSNGTLPEATDNVSVVTGAELTLNTNTSINDIKVAGTLKINSGLALIVNGVSNVTGLVRYFRSLTNNADLAKAWHLVSSPLSGEVFDVAYADKNDIAEGTGSNRGIASYNPGSTGANAWTYFTGTEITTIPGQGYSMKITPDGVTAGEFGTNLVAFEGDFNTADVSKSLTAGFNLLGNPYTSYVNSKTFLDAASANIDKTQMWVWNSSTEDYDAKTAAVAFVLAPAQGFFVKAIGAGAETFAKSNQATEGGTFQKSTTTEVNLWMTDGSAKRYAKLYYLDNATNGFDSGYEGEVFGGVASTLSVFTDLVADSQGKKYQVQSLPNTDYETTVVAVGVKAEAGKEITFTAEALNLPDGIKVFLEDRLTNTITGLDEANANYKVTVSEAIDGIGRFYLHTKASGVLSTDEVLLDNISIYTPNNTTLRVTGLSQGKATVKLFNILGKQVMQTSFTSTGFRDIALSKLATGMYIVQLETEAGKLNKKIVLE